MMKKFLGVMLTLIIFLSFITVSNVKAQTVEATITSKSFDGENYIIKGRIKVSDLNPEGQLPEDDDASIVLDILGENGTFPVFPDRMYIRAPSTCETSYIKNKKCLTNEEYYGKNCKTIGLWSWTVRRMAWQAGAGTDENGGFKFDRSKLKDSYEKDFKIKIPKKFADSTVRLRADLNHSWGGPFASWPAFSFHHTILYEGKLKEIIAGKPKESPEEIMQKLHNIVINTIKTLKSKNKEKDKIREGEGMHIFPDTKVKALSDKQKKDKENTVQKIKDIAKKKEIKVVTVNKPDGSKKTKLIADQKIGFWDKVKYYGSKLAGKVAGQIPGVKYVSDKAEDWTFKKTGLDPVKKTQMDLGADNLGATLYNHFNRFDSAEKKMSSMKTFINTVSNTVTKPFSYVIDKLGLSIKQRTASAYEAEYKTFIKQVKENSGLISVVKKDAEDTGSLTNKWIFDPSTTATNGSKGEFKNIGKRIDYYTKIAKEKGDLPK